MSYFGEQWPAAPVLALLGDFRPGTVDGIQGGIQFFMAFPVTIVLLLQPSVETNYSLALLYAFSGCFCCVSCL